MQIDIKHKKLLEKNEGKLEGGSESSRTGK